MKAMNAAFALLLAITACNVKAQDIFDAETDPQWPRDDKVYVQKVSDERRDAEINCLASNMFWEARGEPQKGKLAVGLVTLNRVKKGYANSVCGVVTQKHQFSWYKPGKILSTGNTLFQEVKDMATMLYDQYYVANTYPDFVQGATHFHTTRVNPSWRKKRLITRIGQHLFFRIGH